KQRTIDTLGFAVQADRLTDRQNVPFVETAKAISRTPSRASLAPTDHGFSRIFVLYLKDSSHGRVART
ncbi:hypothetical protein, partial [Pseudomonas mandelii]|uniref:hypothetical protein n=1 Tax=Pseudomonas mandelii TaxID=75612 RepID=UPI003D01AD14